MTLRFYEAVGAFNSSGCTNNINLIGLFVADDTLEPFSFVSKVISTVPSCSNASLSAIGVRDKNGNPVYTQSGCFNQYWRTSGYNCGRYNGSTGLTIVRGEAAVTPIGFNCLNGVCTEVFTGQPNPAFLSADYGSYQAALAECNRQCAALGSGGCNCPPPSICLTQEEAKEIMALTEAVIAIYGS